MINTKVIIDDKNASRLYISEKQHSCLSKAKRYLQRFKELVDPDGETVIFYGRIFTVSNQIINLK